MVLTYLPHRWRSRILVGPSHVETTRRPAGDRAELGAADGLGRAAPPTPRGIFRCRKFCWAVWRPLAPMRCSSLRMRARGSRTWAQQRLHVIGGKAVLAVDDVARFPVPVGRDDRQAADLRLQHRLRRGHGVRRIEVDRGGGQQRPIGVEIGERAAAAQPIQSSWRCVARYRPPPRAL